MTDVDRAKEFYVDKVGFNDDEDHTVTDEMRFVQLTPPGSACSISIGKGITEMAPGSVQGLQLVVADIEEARARSARAASRSRTSGLPLGPLRLLRRPGRQRLGSPADSSAGPTSGIAEAPAEALRHTAGVIHDAQGFWLSQEEQVEANAILDGEVRADVVVLGGGFSGMWTAWLIREAEPNARVVLLEAGLCGHGPSGRNGGFANSMWFGLGSMRDSFGDEGTLALAEAAESAIGEIGEWCSAQEVDASFRHGGYLQVSTAQAHDQVWEPAVAACEELGRPDAVEVLRADEVQERCASPIFRGAALLPGLGDRQPRAPRARPAPPAHRDRGGGVRALEGPEPQGRARAESRREPTAGSCAPATPCSPRAERRRPSSRSGGA